MGLDSLLGPYVLADLVEGAIVVLYARSRGRSIRRTSRRDGSTYHPYTAYAGCGGCWRGEWTRIGTTYDAVDPRPW